MRSLWSSHKGWGRVTRLDKLRVSKYSSLSATHAATINGIVSVSHPETGGPHGSQVVYSFFSR